MKTPLKSFFKKINFSFLAISFVAGAGFGFIPVTALAATSTITVTVDGGTVSPNYAGKQLVIGQTYKLQAKPKSGFDFVGWTGSQTTDAEKISFVMDLNLDFTATFADVKKPKLTIKTPSNKSTSTNNAVQVTGVVKDNSTIAQVFYQLNGSGWLLASTANGWSNWWANITLDPGTNIFQAFAVDMADNISSTNKITLTYRPLPASLSGQAMVVSSGDMVDFTMNFTNTSFSQSAANTNFVDGVGTYTFTKVNSTTGKLTVRYTAPSNATSDGKTAYLQFTGANSGQLTNGDSSISTFVLSLVTNSVPVSLGGAEFSLASTNSDTQRILSFIAEPAILDNGNLFNVANPLVISVSSAYAGNIGDRVSVLFNHFKSTSVVTNIFVGTVIAATSGAATNTVTVLFDSSSFVSHDKSYVPVAGSLLNVLTFYYTNFISGSVDSAGTGTYTYVIYSPLGALLNLTQTDQNSSYVLTFDSTGDSGTYYEQISPTGSASSSDAGSFNLIAPPQIITEPQDTTVTNGATATFSVFASGSPALIYQWQTNNVNLADGGNISGSASPDLSVSNVTTNDANSYLVIVSNSFGSVTSSVANLNIDTNSIPGP